MKIVILLLFYVCALIAESAMPTIDKNKISNIPLSSSYATNQNYYLEATDDRSALVYTKENSGSLWWAIVVLFLGLSLSLRLIGFAKVHTTQDNKIYSPSTFIIHEVKSQRLLTPEPTRIIASIATLIVTVILFKLLNGYSHEKLIFDSKKGYFFHHKISKDDEIKVLHSMPFKNIIGVQKIRHDQPGKKFYNFEVNLVLSDYSRINLFATQQSNDINLKSSLISNVLDREIIEHIYKE